MADLTHYVHDYETFPNCFIACFEHYKKDIEKVFVIHDLENNLDVLVNFLQHNANFGEWHVSYNGLGFDAQITEFILRNYKWLSTLRPRSIAFEIYQKAQDVIGRSQRREFQEYPEWKLSIKQVDVFKMNHWDNAAKMSALKWIQCSMDWFNVQDMPIHHTVEIETREQIDEIISYCKNDVKSTKKIMQLSTEQINLRGILTKEYGINLYSASEPRISKELFLYFLEKKTGIARKELKENSTYRSHIAVKDILLPYINFERQEFKMLLNNFRDHVIQNPSMLKGAFKYSVKYKGVKIDLGLGGIHGFGKKGIYESKDGFVIKSVDVTSFYPNLAIRNGWAPAHLPKKAFLEQYEWFYDERKKIPKKDPRNLVYKLILNSTYGLSIESNSFLYDPQYGMQTTINGQLLICMLAEMLSESIPESNLLMLNTDGLEIRIPEKYTSIYEQKCKEWEKLTKLELEHEQYEKLLGFDVNNYIALYDKNSPAYKSSPTKCKGRFEFEDHEKYKVSVLHKNKSFLIVPKAIYHYFINGIDPETYLQENRKIFDYCGCVRARGAWKLTKYTTASSGITTEELQKTLRYYVTTKGNKIIKVNSEDGREIQVEAGKSMLKVFNLYEEKKWEDYHVDNTFYLKNIKKEIEAIQPRKNQLKMFE